MECSSIATSTSTVSPSAGRRAVSPPSSPVPKSVTSQFRPASSRAASPAATSAEQHGGGEEDVVRPRGGDDRLERVHPRLRERGLELRAVDHVDGRCSEPPRARCDSVDAVADDNARDVAAERRGARQDAQRTLLDHPVVVLEEDESRHRSFLSESQSTSFSAALPSSSILI